MTEGGETLPDEPPDEGGLRWAPGALDGVTTHHAGVSGDDAKVDEILRLIGQAAKRGASETEAIEVALAAVDPVAIVDPLLQRLPGSKISPADVESVGRRLATTAGSRNAVKLGIAMLGVLSSRSNRDLLMTLGRHDEFTLYSAVALARTEPDPDGALWYLARLVDGWGRIHLVERLRDTSRPEIQDWILRDGFRNAVMDEYLAYIAATTGGLTRALERDQPDDEVLKAACDIIGALISGGPAEDIDDYADAGRAIELLLGHLETSAGITLHHLLAVGQIEDYLADDERWAGEDRPGWPTGLRERLLAACAAIIARPEWTSLAEAGLAAEDRVTFWEAERAARLLGIDTLDAHLDRLVVDPLEDDWQTVMQIVDEPNVGRVLELAELWLPLRAIASGPGMALGFGPEYRGHRALGMVVQGLRRFPGRGWPLISSALRSPVINNRNMAMDALEAWDPSDRHGEVEPVLRAAVAIEPDDLVRGRMEGLVAPREP